MNLHASLQLYLMSSYYYYCVYDSIIEDSEYDRLAKRLLKHYDKWQDHQHAYLVTKEDLKAGTLYTLKAEDYPTVVKVAADMRARDVFTREALKEANV